MKIIGRLILFLLLVAIAGAAVHYVLFRNLGLFVWHLESEPNIAIVRTERPTADGSADTIGIAEGADVSTADPTAPVLDDSATAPPVPAPPKAQPLFNGKDLTGWKSIQFGGEGDVSVNEEGNLEFGFGAIMTGAKITGEPAATSNYEIELDAMRLDGNDFFCAVTFPVKDSHATFIIGGWGGGLVGISSIDDLDASENESMNIEGFEDNKWVHVKIKVTDDKLEAWLDERQMVDVDLEDRKISLRPGDIELCKPLGLACYSGVRAQYKNITMKKLP